MEAPVSACTQWWELEAKLYGRQFESREKAEIKWNIAIKCFLCNVSNLYLPSNWYDFFFDLYKDCLRTVPGTVFSADLYDQWLTVLDKGNDEEARDIQRWFYNWYSTLDMPQKATNIVWEKYSLCYRALTTRRMHIVKRVLVVTHITARTEDM